MPIRFCKTRVWLSQGLNRSHTQKNNWGWKNALQIPPSHWQDEKNKNMRRRRIWNLSVHSDSATALFNTTPTNKAPEMPHKPTHKHYVQTHQLQMSAQYQGALLGRSTETDVQHPGCCLRTWEPHINHTNDSTQSMQSLHASLPHITNL